jgi:hypothetical protein
MKRPVLFTDLDNTAFVLETLNLLLTEFVKVDYVSRRNLHILMTCQAYRIFLDLCYRQSLVAVTTRSLEQFQRTTLAKHIPYAIVDNGATILIEGVEDLYWTKFIQEIMKASGIDHNDAMNKFISKIGYSNVTKVDRFKYFGIVYLDDTANALVAANMSEFDQAGFKTSLQNNKFYLIPDFLTKGLASQYLCLKMGWTQIISAGDSLPDLEIMLDSGLQSLQPEDFGPEYAMHRSPECAFALISPYGELLNHRDLPLNHRMFEKIEGKAALVLEQILVEYCKMTNQEDLL